MLDISLSTLALVAGGLGFAGFGLYRVYDLWAFRRRALDADGVVTDVRERLRRARAGRFSYPYLAYHPVLAFRTADGREVQTEAKNFSKEEHECQVDDEVAVRYDPHDPARAFAGSELGAAHDAAQALALGGLILVLMLAGAFGPW